MEQQWTLAAAWIGLALAASLISMRTGLSVALVEILVGVAAGNFLHLGSTEWTTFLAGFGSILLTFLAGAEVEPDVLRKHLKESIGLGVIGFLAPFLGVAALCHYGAGWTRDAAIIGGIALSTTSVAVVYAVMVETQLNRTPFGKVLLAACFVNDLGTVLALGVFFASFNSWLFLFAAASIGALVLLPPLFRFVLARFGAHVSEPGIKLLLLMLFGLGGLAAKANSEAVLPAYLLGVAVAQIFAQERELVRRLRTTVFALLTPFYFLRAGALVSLSALWSGAAVVAVLLSAKMASKILGIYPLTRLFRFSNRKAWYTTLLMCTGLTFGTISAMFGYNHGIITQGQYSMLVAAVIASAVVPTTMAQAWARPSAREVGYVGEAPLRPSALAASQEE